MRNWTENQIKLTVTWIRHGRTKGNEEHRYLGKTDEPLSENGILQLTEQKKTEKKDAGTLLFSSPMLRCIQTAELLYGRTPIQIPEWEEMDFGRFEGKNYKELCGDPDYQKWIDSNGTLPFPEGESREQFLARCMQGFDRMIDKVMRLSAGFFDEGEKKGAEPELTATAVVHGGTIMAVLSTLTGSAYFDFQVENGQGYETVIKIRMNEQKTVETVVPESCRKL